MITIRHKFLDKEIVSDTEILIIGTFNPDTENNTADYFYGRNKNYLWRLLATSYGEADLKGKNKSGKMQFIKERKINFIDLIEEVKVEKGKETNYNDAYLDNKVTKWRNIQSEIDKLPNLKKVCFTRKSFSDVPNIKNKIVELEKLFNEKGILFKYLVTPARIYSVEKQNEWTNFFTS